MAENKVTLSESDFKPVEVETKPGEWAALPAEISASGPEAPASAAMPAANPQLTGVAVPSEDQTKANILRYGVPVAAGLATGGASLPVQLAVGGLSAMGSEITARQIERAATDPEMETLWSDIKAGYAAGVMDVAVGGAMTGLAHGITALGRRILLPRSMPPDVELAQTVLGKMKDPAITKKWYQFKGKNDPFSLTLGQLNNEERGFVTWLEGIARGGTGKGIMTKFDLRNSDHVAEALDKYFAGRTAQMTGPEFGVFMKRVLGTVDNPGEAFKPVEAFKAYLYKQFDDALANANATVDLSKVQKLLQTSRHPDLLKVYKRVALPTGSGDNLLPSIVKGDWSKLPAQDVDTVLHSFSDFFDSPDPALRRAAKNLKDAIDQEFTPVVNKIPGAAEARNTANLYFGQKQEALYNATITALRKSLKNKPSGIAATLDPTKGNAAIKYDQMSKIKNAVYFSAATPSVPGSAGGIGRQNAIKMYEDSIIQPLRFRFVDAASDQFGRLDPAKMLQQIEKIEAEAPEMLNELWGSSTQVKYIKELASTYNTVLNSTPEKSIFIQLKTAAAIGGAMGGAWSYFNGDNPTSGVAAGGALGAAAVLISPVVLAKALSNPTLTRALTDGLKSSPGQRGVTTTLAMAFRKMGEMKVASTLFRDSPSSDVMQFYNFAPVEEVRQE